MTKLQVSKSKRSITLVENRPIPLNCSVKSQTSPDSHFAVLWYVHKPSDADGKLILKTTHSSAFEYGTYAEEEGLRGRLLFECPSDGTAHTYPHFRKKQVRRGIMAVCC